MSQKSFENVAPDYCLHKHGGTSIKNFYFTYYDMSILQHKHKR